MKKIKDIHGNCIYPGDIVIELDFDQPLLIFEDAAGKPYGRVICSREHPQHKIPQILSDANKYEVIYWTYKNRKLKKPNEKCT